MTQLFPALQPRERTLRAGAGAAFQRGAHAHPI